MVMREKVACKLPKRSLLIVGILALLALPSLTLAQREAPAKPAQSDVVMLTDLDSFELVMLDELLLIDTPSDERDRKLAELEAKIQAILKEIQSMKQKGDTKPEVRRDVLRLLHEKLVEHDKAAAKGDKKLADQKIKESEDAAKKAKEAAIRALEKIDKEKLAGEAKKALTLKVDERMKLAEAQRKLALEAEQKAKAAALDDAKKLLEMEQKRAAEALVKVRAAEAAGKAKSDAETTRSRIARLETLRETVRSTPSTEVITLSRTTYTLTAPKAEALAKFLKDNIKSGNFTVSIEGAKLIVTTTPETQKVIGGLVALMQDQAFRIDLRNKSPEPSKD